MTVLLVDDEKTVRDGLKVILDWQAYGFDTVLEGEDGNDALSKMVGFNPDLTLLDIRMPKLSGLEAAEQARKAGYEGKIIMMSGYSDFKYAQSAIRFGVEAYLLKSIDEYELASAVQKVSEDVLQKAEASRLENKNAELARNSLLCDVLLGRSRSGDELNLQRGALKSGVYRVVLFDFCKDKDECRRKLAENMLRGCFTESQVETAAIDGKLVMILKDAEAISRLSEAVNLARRRAGVSIFAGMGRSVNSVDEMALSYQDARQIIDEKFFYSGTDDIICFGYSPSPTGNCPPLDPQKYLGRIQTYVEVGEPERIKAVLGDIRKQILAERIQPEKAKGILSGLYIGLLGKLRLSGSDKPCKLPIESGVIDIVFGMDHLNDIIGFFEDEFCRLSFDIAGANRDILAKMLAYIEKNSGYDLKLESIAEIFGYNSTYLGKIFKKSTGESFNTYLDRLRIRKAEALLSGSALKVYEICERVGYRNLNYFYKKFKSYAGASPSEYRDRALTR